MASATWAWYKSMLASRPLLTKATTSAIIMSGSDILCQRVETTLHQSIMDKHGPTTNLQGGCPANVTASPAQNPDTLFRFDWNRTSHVALTGFTWNGPIAHTWYQLLEMIVTTRHVIWGMTARLLLDAVVFSPVAVAGYFIWRSILEGQGKDAIVTKLKTKWIGAVHASWSFWPVANLVNFGLVPIQLRVLFNNALSLLWNGYLSHVNSERLESIVEERVHCPHDIIHQVDKQQSEGANVVVPCVCSHCRPVRG